MTSRQIAKAYKEALPFTKKGENIVFFFLFYQKRENSDFYHKKRRVGKRGEGVLNIFILTNPNLIFLYVCALHFYTTFNNIHRDPHEGANFLYQISKYKTSIC